jgi:hypothetical protein
VATRQGVSAQADSQGQEQAIKAAIRSPPGQTRYPRDGCRARRGFDIGGHRRDRENPEPARASAVSLRDTFGPTLYRQARSSDTSVPAGRKERVTECSWPCSVIVAPRQSVRCACSRRGAGATVAGADGTLIKRSRRLPFTIAAQLLRSRLPGEGVLPQRAEAAGGARREPRARLRGA